MRGGRLLKTDLCVLSSQIDLSDVEIVDRAAQVGVGIMSAQAHYLNAQLSGEFIFGYGELTPGQLQEGIRRVAKVLTK